MSELQRPKTQSAPLTPPWLQDELDAMRQRREEHQNSALMAAGACQVLEQLLELARERDYGSGATQAEPNDASTCAGGHAVPDQGTLGEQPGV